MPVDRAKSPYLHNLNFTFLKVFLLDFHTVYALLKQKFRKKNPVISGSNTEFSLCESVAPFPSLSDLFGRPPQDVRWIPFVHSEIDKNDHYKNVVALFLPTTILCFYFSFS